jgi:hypothetical protein
MKNFFRYFVCFLGLFALLSGCRDQNPDPIPSCQVSIIIWRDSHDNKLAPGMIRTFNSGRGYAGCDGVVVLNLDDIEFLAYDRSCPNCWRYFGTVIEHKDDVQPRPTNFQCSICESKFDILDGQPMSGAVSRYPMKKYKVSPHPQGGSKAFLVHR